MKLVTINNALLLKYNGDSEILQKSTRPYVLVIRLKYKGLNYDFAVPIRSNIPASAPKNQYFALPPRPYNANYYVGGNALFHPFHIVCTEML